MQKRRTKNIMKKKNGDCKLLNKCARRLMAIFVGRLGRWWHSGCGGGGRLGCCCTTEKALRRTYPACGCRVRDENGSRFNREHRWRGGPSGREEQKKNWLEGKRTFAAFSVCSAYTHFVAPFGWGGCFWASQSRTHLFQFVAIVVGVAGVAGVGVGSPCFAFNSDATRNWSALCSTLYSPRIKCLIFLRQSMPPICPHTRHTPVTHTHRMYPIGSTVLCFC